jgi:hypothetical protein
MQIEIRVELERLRFFKHKFYRRNKDAKIASKVSYPISPEINIHAAKIKTDYKTKKSVLSLES